MAIGITGELMAGVSVSRSQIVRWIAPGRDRYGLTLVRLLVVNTAGTVEAEARVQIGSEFVVGCHSRGGRHGAGTPLETPMQPAPLHPETVLSLRKRGRC